MPAPLTINVSQAAASAPLVHTISASGEIEALAAFAHFDGAAASGPFLACLSFYSGQGLLLARVFPQAQLSVGDTADITYAPSLSSELNAGQSANTFKTISAASTNATLVQAGPTTLVSYYISNQNASVRYVKFYNKASSPTVGTDVPSWTLGIPSLGAANLELNRALEFPLGLGFAITTGVADSDAGAVAANEIVVNLGYN